MAVDRVEALKAMLAQDPNNSFVRYALAQAQAGAGKLDEAVSAYRQLIDADPTYVAAYFHGGQALEKLGQVDEAREIYVAGIEACTAKGDFHTRSEIQGALDMLP